MWLGSSSFWRFFFLKFVELSATNTIQKMCVGQSFVCPQRQFHYCLEDFTWTTLYCDARRSFCIACLSGICRCEVLFFLHVHFLMYTKPAAVHNHQHNGIRDRAVRRINTCQEKNDKYPLVDYRHQVQTVQQNHSGVCVSMVHYKIVKRSEFWVMWRRKKSSNDLCHLLHSALRTNTPSPTKLL